MKMMMTAKITRNFILLINTKNLITNVKILTAAVVGLKIKAQTIQKPKRQINFKRYSE